MIRYVLAAAALAVATSASATLITFDADSCFTPVCSNGDYLNTAFADVGGIDFYTYSAAGPGDTALVEPYTRWWGSGYGDLDGVTYGGIDSQSGVANLILSAAPRFRLNGFSAASFGGVERTTEFRIYDGGFNLIYSTGPVTIPASGHRDFVVDVVRPFALILQWGPDANGVAVDNLDYTADVPEPASWAMMIGGFGLVGSAMRRRRAVPA